MALVDRLLEQLSARGINVVYVDDANLKLTGNTKQATPALMSAVKEFKPELLVALRPKEKMEICNRCCCLVDPKEIRNTPCCQIPDCPYGERDAK